ncbi:MAG TPA: hypothetical protein VGO47_13620, partial [Chlamydiales bacterium]|nr:hypothetical protein [Chlamydiales bacterium]
IKSKRKQIELASALFNAAPERDYAVYIRRLLTPTHPQKQKQKPRRPCFESLNIFFAFFKFDVEPCHSQAISLRESLVHI